MNSGLQCLLKDRLSHSPLMKDFVSISFTLLRLFPELPSSKRCKPVLLLLSPLYTITQKTGQLNDGYL